MPATPKRPGTILGAAILLLIFGVYSILGGVCGGIVILTPDAIGNLMPKQPGVQGKAQDPLAPQRQVALEAPAYVPFALGFTGFTVLLGLLATIAGIRALKMAPAARSLGVFVAIAVILSTLVQTGYNFAYVIPITARVTAEQQKERPPGMPDMSGVTTGAMYGGAIFGVIFNIVIWGIVIMLLRSKSATDAFAGKFPEELTSEQEKPSRYEGYDDDDPVRRPPPPKSPGDTGITDRPS